MGDSEQIAKIKRPTSNNKPETTVPKDTIQRKNNTLSTVPKKSAEVDSVSLERVNKIFEGLDEIEKKGIPLIPDEVRKPIPRR